MTLIFPNQLTSLLGWVTVGYFINPNCAVSGFHAKVVCCDKASDLYMYSSFKRTSIFLR